MLSATPLQGSGRDASQPLIAYIPEVNRSGPGGGTVLTPVVPQGPAPFALSETFLLHSNPGAAQVIYLDFDGHITRETQWNAPDMQNPNGIPNIVTPSISATGFFSDDEKVWVQRVWARVAEDYLPFDVDVTTDPAVEPLLDGNGVRAAIGGSNSDWINRSVGGVAYVPSFTLPNSANGYDTPVFIFPENLGQGNEKFVTDAISHEVGHSLGLFHQGEVIPGQANPAQYYAGHGPNSPNQTGWGPIMGAAFDKELTQWSKAEYPNAISLTDPPSLQDDMAVIPNGSNIFGWWDGEVVATDDGYTRVDEVGDPLPDHGDDIADATDLDFTATSFFGEGLIDGSDGSGANDVDFFGFWLTDQEQVSFTIDQAAIGPNLDILATLYDSGGEVIATSNPHEALNASFTIDLSTSTVTYLDVDGTIASTVVNGLSSGQFYISIDGTGKTPSSSDAGYSDYGSLGYYSIKGVRDKGLVVVGVDFDVPGGIAPENWNLYTGGGSTGVLTGLINEVGSPVPYTLSIGTTGASIDTYHSDSPIISSELPDHAIPLDELSGFISAEDETTTFTWGNLEPLSYHTIYVFGHADFDAHNVVTVTGGNLNGTIDTAIFDQTIAADGLIVNNRLGTNAGLSTFAMQIFSDANGQITISVTNAPGFESAIAGLAISPTRPFGPAVPGSISGKKWNDLDGDQIKDSNEPGLADWVIYLDVNNNGQLDTTTTPGAPDSTVTVSSGNILQAIPDEDDSGIKSTLQITNAGTIKDITVALDITHTYDSDLNVVLISPSGTRVKLVTSRGSNGDNFHNTVFNDSATASIKTASAPFTGTFRPEESLLHFPGDFGGDRLLGESALGSWQLEVKDHSQGDFGTLNSWSLTLDLQGATGATEFLEPTAITDANGNYTFDNLPIGLYNVREYFSPAQVLEGWVQTWQPTPITVTSGSGVTNVNFGNWIPIAKRGSIQGQKYYDGNQNGVKDDSDPGLSDWIVYVDLNNNGVRDIAIAPDVVASTDVPKPILDSNTIQSQVTVGALGTIFDVEVTVDITHSYMGDLDAYLVSPTGTQVKLFSGVGGQYNDFHNLKFSDSAARSISEIGFDDLPYSGTWKPQGNLSDFSGDDAAGTWTLVITDTASADQGILNSWSLAFLSGELFRTTDENGNYQFANVAPGSYTIREELKPGWTQVAPADTTIPAATWSANGWAVTVVGIDPVGGGDSLRNVKNVDFGNYAATGSIAGYVYRDFDASATKAATEPGLPGWTVFVDANNNGALDTASVDSTVSTTTAEAINNVFAVSSKLWFGSLASVSDVNVSLDISHTYDSDLTAYLISPSGTRVKLFSNVGSSGDDFQGTTFDDSATDFIVAGSAPFADAFKPAEPLSKFKGESAVGYWTLEIKDSFAGDDGTLNSWSLSIVGDELSVVTDAQGHYSFANLPPTTYHLDTVQVADWTRTEVPGAVALLAGQALLTANFGEYPPYFQGDFNSDGVVDSADFLVWRRQSGTNRPNFTGADADGDGDVDQEDLALWRQNFGKYRDDHGNNALAATSAALPASVGGKIEVGGDVDWFSFTAVGGTLYRIKATLGTLGAGSLQIFGTDGTTQLATNSSATPLIEWTAPSNGIYYAQVKGLSASSVGTYTLGVAAVVIDDHGNDAASSTLISVPSVTAGEIEIANDVDWFKFNAVIGNVYNIFIQLDTLPYATLRVIDTNGTTQLLLNGGFGPSVQWTPPASGTYYLEAAGLTFTGRYLVSISVDDHGNTAGSATPIAVPSTTAGNIEAPSEVDLFSFVATSGTSYRFQTTLYTLGDSTLRVFGTNGTTELAFDDDGGGGLSSRIDWIAPSAGTYFVQVSGLGSAYGTYDLTASINPPGSGSSMLLAPAGAGLMMDGADASLLTSVQPVDSTDNSPLLASFVSGSQGTSGGSAPSSTKPISPARAESGAQNDLALLAWLASSSDGSHSGAGQSLADDDLSASRLSDEPESLDVAFELLEGNALASATI